MPANMNRYQMEIFIGQTFGRSIGWLANVINTSQPRPTKKLRALARLASEDRVGSGVMIDQISIDGRVVSLSELDNYAK